MLGIFSVLSVIPVGGSAYGQLSDNLANLIPLYSIPVASVAGQQLIIIPGLSENDPNSAEIDELIEKEKDQPESESLQLGKTFEEIASIFNDNNEREQKELSSSDGVPMELPFP